MGASNILQVFTEQDVCTIRRLWTLDRRQLFEGSQLRTNLRCVEQDDEREGTNIAQEAKSLIDKIVELEKQITEAESGTDLSIDSWSVNANYSVKLKGDRDASYGLRTQYNNCMNDLATLLRIPRRNYVIRRWRTG